MRKILMVLMMVFGLSVTFTACNSTLEEPGKTIALAIKNDTGNDIVIVLTDKQGNNMYWERHNCIKNGEVGMIVLDSEQHINVGFDFNAETGDIKGGIWSNFEKAWDKCGGLTDSYVTLGYSENGPTLCGNLISKFN